MELELCKCIVEPHLENIYIIQVQRPVRLDIDLIKYKATKLIKLLKDQIYKKRLTVYI
jgi:hypothetical protein